MVVWKGLGGDETIDHVNDSLNYTPMSIGDFVFEPIPMGDIKKFKKSYPDFLMEVFHGKLIQSWNNCLDDIFSYFVYSHFSGQRTFVELGANHPVKLNFKIVDRNEFISQIPQSTIEGFKSKEYPERIKTITSAFNTKIDKKYFKEIYKNVLVRHAIQHNNSILNENILGRLGDSNSFKILDTNGKSFQCRTNEKITLSFFEIKSCIDKMQFIVEKWRESEGKK